jgi:hypothetical protein
MSISKNFIDQIGINHEMITDDECVIINKLKDKKIIRYMNWTMSAIGILIGALSIIDLMFFDSSNFTYLSLAYGIHYEYIGYSLFALFLLAIFFNREHQSKVRGLRDKFGGWSSSDIKTKEDALEIIKKAGDDEVVSLYKLALMYQKGFFVPVNKKISLAYYAMAVDKGDGLAAYKISKEYATNGYFDLSEQDEYDWLLKGRELGNVKCVKALAQIEGNSNTNNVKSNASPLLFVSLLFFSRITVA